MMRNPALHVLRLILGVHFTTAWRALTRSPSAQSAVLLGMFVLGPAALAAGQRCRQALDGSGSAAAAAVLIASVFLAVQAVWLLILLLPGGAGLTLFGPVLPASALRFFPIRPHQIVLAGVIGAFLDLPLLFALPVFGAVLSWLSTGFAGKTLIGGVVFLFLLQTAALAKLIEHSLHCLVRNRWRRGLIIVLIGALVVGVCFGLRPTLAAAYSSSSSQPLRRGAPYRFGKQAPQPLPLPAPELLPMPSLFPPALAARTIVAITEGNALPAVVGLAGLAGLTLLTFAGASRVQQIALIGEGSGGGSRHRSRLRALPNRGRISALRRSPAWEQVCAVAAIEWRNLVRNPAAHLPLRGPAALVFLFFFAWIAPNRGDDPVRTLWDMLGMGSILYGALWQIQLLCNRFGNEAGTAALLLRFPVSRARLMVGKNLALAALLLLVNGTMGALLCLLIAAPRLIFPVMGWVLISVVLLTISGNLLSVLYPFPIAPPQRQKGFPFEPERSVAFLYVLIAVGIWAVLSLTAQGLNAARAAGPALTLGFFILCGGLLAALYAASVALSARLLCRNELLLIQRLDAT